jgi:hypothetical protein
VKIKDGQQWDVEIHSRKPKLRYRHIGKGRAARQTGSDKALVGAHEELKMRKSRIGEWRKVGDGHWWKVGNGSGLPQNLFHPLQECILEEVMKLTPSGRDFHAVRRPLRRGLAKGAALVGSDMTELGRTHYRFSLKNKAAIEFLIYDYHRHKPDEFYKKDAQYNQVKNPKGMPERALGQLAERLRQHTAVRRFEQDSKALLRWLVVVLKPSETSKRNIWLVPAKSRKEH